MGRKRFEHSFGRTIIEESRVAAILVPFSVCDHFCVRVGRCDGASRIWRLCHRDQPAGAVRVNVVIFCIGISLLSIAVDHGGVATTR